MKRWVCGFGFGIVMSLAAVGPGQAGEVSPELRRVMADRMSWEPIDVIVEFEPVDLKAVKAGFVRQNKVWHFQSKKAWRKAFRRKLVKELRQRAKQDEGRLEAGVRPLRLRGWKRLWLKNGLAARVPGYLVEELAGWPGVKRVSHDRIIKLRDLAPIATPAQVPPPTGPAEPNIAAIGAPELWARGYDGSGIVVAIMDSGVDLSHPDLGPRYRGGGNSWFDPHGENPDPRDPDGHGTQALGIMLGGDASGGTIGVAPGAQWIAAKIFNDAGEASLSAIHQGFQWLLDPDGDPATDDAPDVVNNSWYLATAGNACETEFAQDIAALRAAGINVVFAAGNQGPQGATGTSPANNPGGISVGSVDSGGLVSDFSSRGPSACPDDDGFPDLVAPGEAIVTADLTFGLPYAFTTPVSGTSFAAPHVAGALAVLKGAFPEATPDELEAALERGALDLGEPGTDNDHGAGMLNLPWAYDILLSTMGPDDADGDGVPATTDCDDSDPTVFPGAPEIKHDGIDQDCNGFDLSIAIKRVRYQSARDRLVLWVTSDRAAQAGLKVTIELATGGTKTLKLKWKARRARWQKVIKGFAAKHGAVPVAVTVFGAEGSETAAVRGR